jgi:hypothetical protein
MAKPEGYETNVTGICRLAGSAKQAFRQNLCESQKKSGTKMQRNGPGSGNHLLSGDKIGAQIRENFTERPLRFEIVYSDVSGRNL